MVGVSLNGGEPARFLVDTGSSVVIVAPGVAAAAGVTASPKAPRIELQTVAGRSSGPAVPIRSLRVGDLELRDVLIVLHDPGPGFDGILGNAFLSRYRLTLDPDRHLLVLRPLVILQWGPRNGPHASRTSGPAVTPMAPTLGAAIKRPPAGPGAE
jgi:predicted aspartyl protease